MVSSWFRLSRRPWTTALISLKSSVLVHACGMGAFMVGSWYVQNQLDQEADLAGRSGVIVIQLSSAPSSPAEAPVEPPIDDVAIKVAPQSAPSEPAAAVPVDASPLHVATTISETTTQPEKQTDEPPPLEAVEAVEVTTQESVVAAEPSRAEPPPSSPPSLQPAEPITVATPRRAPAAPPSIASPAIPPIATGFEKMERPVFSGNAPPEYPALAQQNGWHGTVLLRITIDEAGSVVEAKIETSSGFAILDSAAKKAVEAWRAQPAKKNGRSIRTVELLPVIFRPRI